MLEFKVTNQLLVRVDKFNPATDSVDYLKAKFLFSTTDWSGKTKTALFRSGTKTYKKILNSDGTCTIPSEVLVASSDSKSRIASNTNKIYVSLIGEYSTTRITTNEVKVEFNLSGYGDALTPSAPTESEYQQIVTQYENARAEMQEATEECQNAQERLDGVGNLFANAIKGNLSGAVVFADDVSPVEHEPSVKVHGKNLFQTNELLIDKGTAYGGSPQPFYGVAGKTYTISANFEQLGTVTKIGISLTTSDGRWIKEVYGDLTSGKLTISFTYPIIYTKDGFVSIGFFSNILPQAVEGAKCQYTNIQVEEGNVATDYEPWVDPSTVTVRRCGKNLLPYPFYQSSSEINGCKFTANSDGSVSASGTATGVSYLTIYSGEPLVKNGNFTISLGGSYQNIIYHLILLDGTGNELLVIQDYLTKTINADDYPTCTKWMLNIKRHENKAVSGRVYPQIEVGEVVTSHEVYIEPVEYTPSSDGTVEGITSLSPNMTILTDTEGVIVECEYNKDTNVVVKKLADALGITI